MSDILEELYYGELSPEDAVLANDGETSRLMDILREKEQVLHNSMGGVDPAVYEECKAAEKELREHIALMAFRKGYELATRLLTAALSEK